jgi:hypothetical protein
MPDSDQVIDNVVPRSAGDERGEDLLPPLAGGRYPGKRVVLDEVRSQERVDDVRISGLAGRIIRLRPHHATESRSQWRGRNEEREGG